MAHLLASLALAVCATGHFGPAAARDGASVGTGPAGQEHGAPDLDAEYEAALEALVERLLAHAQWCEKQDLGARRAAALRAILTVRPQESRALRALGYRKDREGRWSEPKRRLEPRDRARDALPEAARRWRVAIAPFRDRLLDLLEARREEAGDGLRERWLGAILALDPDDERAHALRGEVRFDERWVLAETAAARRGRVEIKQAVRGAIESAPPARTLDRLPREGPLGEGLDGPVGHKVVRAFGAVPRDELVRAVERVTAARTAFRELLSTDADYPRGATLWLFPDGASGRAWLARHPGLEEDRREFLATLEGGGLQGTPDFATWADDPRRRLDALVRVSIGWLLADGFAVTAEHGWLFEGLGLYLTRELIGTRLTWFVRPSEYLRPEEDTALRRKLLDPQANWMAEAAALFASERSPHLAFMLPKDVTRLTTEELLLSYVSCAYLLEARRKELPELLRRLGAGEAPAKALEAALGLDVATLDERVRRWLGERR